jgi:hypothetical protein
MSATTALIHAMKSAGEDFEFYPTTDAIISCVKADMYRAYRQGEPSVLDCGAGDGRVLLALTKGERYAIEQSTPALRALPADVAIVGTDFHQQTLLDKPVDVVFCNPPYSEFRAWMLKIIRETLAPVAYFVVPSRWSDNDEIQSALTDRKASARVLGSFDFADGDRAARAVVDVIRVDLGEGMTARRGETTVDPFALWFESHFDVQAPSAASALADVQGNPEHYSDLISSRGLVDTLAQLYDRDMVKLMDNYGKLAGLDADLLSSLGIDIKSAAQGLKQRIENLKNLYWRELFDRLDVLTARLTAASRNAMMQTLFRRTNVDFSYDNAHAIVLWAIKNANAYLDSQLVDVMERLLRASDKRAYKSNDRLFGEEDYYYNRKDTQNNTPVLLEPRCIYQTHTPDLLSPWTAGKMDYRATEYLRDLITIAAQMNFDTSNTQEPEAAYWETGKLVSFEGLTPSGKPTTLMQVKAFKNGNLHIKFNSDLLLRMNVEFGRVNGWVRSASDVTNEFDIDEIAARRAYADNYRYDLNSKVLLPSL